MNPLEAALYVFLLDGGTQPLSCALRAETEAVCSNGVRVTQISESLLQFSSGARVEKTAEGDLRFSTGLTGWRSSAGWIRFSNGLQVRRAGANLYRFAHGYHCIDVSPREARCLKAIE